MVLVYHTLDHTMEAYDPNVDTGHEETESIVVIARDRYTNPETMELYTGEN